MRAMGYSWTKIQRIKRQNAAAQAAERDRQGWGNDILPYRDHAWERRRRGITWHPVDGVVWEDTGEPANYHPQTDTFTRQHQVQQDAHVRRWRIRRNEQQARARRNFIEAQNRQRAAKHGTWIGKNVLDLTK